MDPRIPTDTSRVPTLPMRGPDNPPMPIRSPADRVVDQLTAACLKERISHDAATILASLARMHERGDLVTDPEFAALGASLAASVFRGAP